MMEEALMKLRAAEWRVAVDNDYSIDGQFFTFWLFTHPSGHFVKGEGSTDLAALSECLRQAECMREAGALTW